MIFHEGGSYKNDYDTPSFLSNPVWMSQLSKCSLPNLSILNNQTSLQL